MLLSYFFYRLPDRLRWWCSQHARLDYAGEAGVSIWDLQSVHGTFVNNVRLAPATKTQLYVGDVVTFGASTRRYVLRFGVT